MTPLIRRLAAIGAALIAACLTMAVPATPAAAATARNGICESGEFCLYKGPSRAGSLSDFASSIPDYFSSQPGCYEFKSYGVGQYQCVKNNAESVWNRSSRTVVVYYNSGYRGASQTILAGATVNLNATLRDDNASHQFFGCLMAAQTSERTESC